VNGAIHASQETLSVPPHQTTAKYINYDWPRNKKNLPLTQRIENALLPTILKPTNLPSWSKPLVRCQVSMPLYDTMYGKVNNFLNSYHPTTKKLTKPTLISSHFHLSPTACRCPLASTAPSPRSKTVGPDNKQTIHTDWRPWHSAVASPVR
jgi:hypothetical protein